MINPTKPDYENTPASARHARFGYAPALAGAAPVVSIVTPYSNVGQVFHETAATVFAQSLQAWEWLIVNDGSTDPGALAVLDGYRGRDPRVRVIDLPEHRGPAAARNEGCRQARAEFVLHLGGTDLLEPTSLEKYAWFLATNPGVAFVNGYSVGFGGRDGLWTGGFHDRGAFLTENRAKGTSLVRRRVHAAVGGFDESVREGMEVWEFWLRCAAAGHWGAAIPEFLDWYRPGAPDHDGRSDGEGGARFPGLHAGEWPAPRAEPAGAFDAFGREPAFVNPLAKSARRLLLIVPWFCLGGADKFNLDLVGQLARRGWEITIATTLAGDHSWMHEFARVTPDIFALPHFCRAADMPAALVHLIRSRRPDAVLVTNSELAYLTLHYLRARCPGPAYLDFIHMEEEYWKNGGYPRYSVGVRDQLDLTVATSEHLKGWMGARGADPDRVEVCTINVEPSVWAVHPARRGQVRREHGIADGSVVLLYPCRLTLQKQPRVFAKALRELDARGVPFEAIVAGDGEDRAWLEAFIRLHGLGPRVRVLGAVPLESMPGLMSAADILFLPSRMEGIALVLFEAMAAGRPVVGADVGGQRELLTPDCGVLLPYPGDEDREAAAYADALAALIADPNTRERMGAAGRERVRRHFTLERMGERMEALIERAIDLHAKGPRPLVGEATAHEIAWRGVEYVRVSQACDRLWQEQTAAQYRAPAPATPAGPGPPLDGSGSASAVASTELAWIEGSRSYRLVGRVKSTAAYRALARLRFGPGWDAQDPHQDPVVRLARIKASSSYRMIQAMKETAVYRWYAARKHDARTLPGGERRV